MAPQSRCATERMTWGSMLALIALATLVEPVQAQGFDLDRLSVVPVVGVTVPTGEIGKYVRAGPTAGVQLMYDLTSRFSVGIEGVFDSHEGLHDVDYTIFSGPPFQMLRYGLTAQAALLPPRPGSLTVIAGGGMGLATMFSEKLYNIASPPIGVTVGGPGQTDFSADPLQFSGTYPAFTGLLRLGYVFDSVLTLFAEGMVLRASVDEEKAAVFVQGPYPVAVVGDDGWTVELEERDPLVTPSAHSSIAIRLGFSKSF